MKENKPKLTRRPGAGRPPTPEEEQCKRGKITVYIAPERIPQMKRLAKAKGLPVSGFLRLLTYSGMDEMDHAA